MSFFTDHPRYTENTGVSKPYLEKNFLPPSYIGRDGEASLDNIVNTFIELQQRTKRLAKDEVPQHTKPDAFEPGKNPDPTDFGSKPTRPGFPTVELPLISDVWNGNEPINYHVQIEVGSPPQAFYVDIDSGSSLFWLQAIINEDQDEPVLGQSSYRPFKSLGAVDQAMTDQAKYGDGDTVKVLLYKDRVGVGKMDIGDVLVGAAPSSALKREFALSKANGILGLGFPTDPANYWRRNIVQTLYDLKKVNHPSFALIGPRNDPKLAAKIDKDTIMQPRGTFVIGSVDPAYYTGSIAWCPQIVASNRWIVKLDKIVVNGQTVFEDQLALIDTGTAYMIASPNNFDKVQKSIEGAQPIDQKKDMMFSFPSASLQSIGFVFGGREISLQPQDFGLGGIKNRQGHMCSSIMRLPEWDFDDRLWIVGGIFLDNVVTVFDYGERKVGFADINEKDVEALAGENIADVPDKLAKAAAEAAAPDAKSSPAVSSTSAIAESATPASKSRDKFIAADTSLVAISSNPSPPKGREFSQPITFTSAPLPKLALGINSLSLGWEHVRLITFPTSHTLSGFTLNFNASTSEETHGAAGADPDSDTMLKGGKAAWLRALPSDPNIQTGQWSMGNPYPKQTSALKPQTAAVKFERSFSEPPKVVLWISCMDFSKSVNWRLKADIKTVDKEGFEMEVGAWADTILYKCSITWIAHSNTPSFIQSGLFSTEAVHPTSTWQLENSGFVKFEKAFSKVPRVVAALNMLEFGYWRDMNVQTETEATEEGVRWRMNSEGNAHPYGTRCGWIAFDADLETVSAAINQA